MSINLSAAASKQFDDDVKHAFQGAGLLRDCVTNRNSVIGDTYNFRKMGKGLANQKASSADVVPMDVDHNLIPCPLANWNAPEYTDVFDAVEVNFDEQQELAYTIASALGRRLDQIVIDAMDAAAAGGVVDTDVGGIGTGLNVAKLRRASRLLNEKGVPMGDRYIATSASGLENLLAETEATSSDYNTVKALVNGELNSFVGFQFKIVEERTEGGLPLAGAARTQYAWHKSSVGLAIGIDVKTEVNYVPQKTSWLANGLMKAGAVSRDDDGIVDIVTTEA